MTPPMREFVFVSVHILMSVYQSLFDCVPSSISIIFHLSWCELICLYVPLHMRVFSIVSQLVIARHPFFVTMNLQSSVMESWYLPSPLVALCFSFADFGTQPSQIVSYLDLHHYFPYLGKLFTKSSQSKYEYMSGCRYLPACTVRVVYRCEG